MFGTRKVITIAAACGLLVCGFSENATGMVVVFVGWFLALQCHAIEVKLNKLLDQQRISVSNDDLENY